MVIPLCCTAQSTAMWVWINILLQRKINGKWMWFDVTPNNYDTIRFDPYICIYIYMRTCTVCTRTDINMVTVLPIEITSGLQLQPLLLCLERKRRRHPNQPTFEHFASISYISYTCMSYIYILYIVIIMCIYIVIKRTQTWQPCTSSKGWIRQTQYPQDGITCQPSVDK